MALLVCDVVLYFFIFKELMGGLLGFQSTLINGVDTLLKLDLSQIDALHSLQNNIYFVKDTKGLQFQMAAGVRRDPEASSCQMRGPSN